MEQSASAENTAFAALQLQHIDFVILPDVNFCENASLLGL